MSPRPYPMWLVCTHQLCLPAHLRMFVCACSVEFVPRYIKTSGNATVDHLSKYLAVRLALEELRRNAEASPVNVEAASEKQYTIYIPTAGNQFTVSTHTCRQPSSRHQKQHCTHNYTRSMRSLFFKSGLLHMNDYTCIFSSVTVLV